MSQQPRRWQQRLTQTTWPGTGGERVVVDRKELLKSIFIFSHLSGTEADAILALMRDQEIAKEEVVFHQQDEKGGLYLILKGEVKISRLSRDGREVTLALLREGNFFGDMSLLDGQPRSATATATVGSRLLVLDRESFLGNVLPMTGIVTKMLEELSKRLRAADQNIENLALGTVFDRLFHFLGHLGRKFPLVGGKSLITRRPTHQELAEVVGSSRETVTRSLAYMEKKGLIAIGREGITLLPAFFEEEAVRSGG